MFGIDPNLTREQLRQQLIQSGRLAPDPPAPDPYAMLPGSWNRNDTGPKAFAGAQGSMPDPNNAAYRQQISGWTGVSSADDPYGVNNIGINLPDNATAKNLLSLNAPAIKQTVGVDGSSQWGSTGITNQYSHAPATGGSSLTGQDQQFMQQQQAKSDYPAHPNSFGLGTSTMPTPQAKATPQSYGPSVTANTNDQASRGLTPWSMLGESNARDTSKGIVTQS